MTKKRLRRKIMKLESKLGCSDPYYYSDLQYKNRDKLEDIYYDLKSERKRAKKRKRKSDYDNYKRYLYGGPHC